mmetsp:Transcript_89519/g.187018  ORF Transcript_89519/g.187018 Transcript_89519/m.187018 type:complete len:433 (+) Transcript_89519:108-1406(+)|eukprot:CAMPEP_0206451784 /NCGR_PEP_ID=MMETSP0324_2-20121206/19554_1 /ASSEMBLY_ACC=CAM_ASM_000836 /TAXON_ID=2866 /ORGANISM="Crypthecodinium cohnii, Strain Seligo" /LENGTH=432 /DNA_ID=CAMNT_0053921745 /DNA_START=74 /DNA_END=1372 /DNA_ORIENTATION=-
MATAEGTSKFLQRAVSQGLLHPKNVRKMPVRGPSQMSVSAVGFGAYRVGGSDKEPLHAAALRKALKSGINLVDTSSHYSDGVGLNGPSERLIGRVVQEAVAAKEVAREEVVICTKVGHAELKGPKPPGAVPIGPPAGQGGVAQDVWHSIHPEFLDEEIRKSAKRLGFSPDYVLLHNPEYFLSAQLQQRVPIADAWQEMYQRLADAFRTLEALVKEGVITNGYGVSGNFLSCMFSTTGRGNLYEALALDRVVESAKVAGGEDHHFTLAQLPLNAFESGAVLGRGSVVPEASEGDCKLAEELGLGLLANRPLNALPLPGVSSGDWGRQGATHLQLRDKKPMGAVESLLKRVILEAVNEEGATLDNTTLQQLALRLSLSSPSVSSTLCGMRQDAYVEDVSKVLAQEPFSEEQVRRAYTTVRQAAEELGCEKRGLW